LEATLAAFAANSSITRRTFFSAIFHLLVWPSNTCSDYMSGKGVPKLKHHHESGVPRFRAVPGGDER
jgi:hypothetical protein